MGRSQNTVAMEWPRYFSLVRWPRWSFFTRAVRRRWGATEELTAAAVTAPVDRAAVQADRLRRAAAARWAVPAAAPARGGGHGGARGGGGGARGQGRGRPRDARADDEAAGPARP